MSAVLNIDDLAYQEFLNPNESTRVPINDFVPRKYQLEVFEAINKFNYVFWVKHRRAGGDFTAVNLAIREMFKAPILCHYVFPTYALAKKVIWNGMSREGKRFIDYFPKDLLTKKPNSSLMTIHMRTQCGRESIFQLVGSNRYNELRGTNPKLVIQSETAYQYAGVLDEIYRPILQENGGKLLTLSTYFGRNHFYNLGEMARKDPDWAFLDHDIRYTGVVSEADIERMRQQGVAEDHIQQEFYNNPNVGAVGAYYAKYINEMRLNGQIGRFPWDASYPVYLAWDLGTSNNYIWFYQLIDKELIFIDVCNINGYTEICKHIKSLPYLTQRDFLPHDAEEHRESENLESLEEILQRLGRNTKVIPKTSKAAQIETVRNRFSMIRINEDKCEHGIQALCNYRQEYDAGRQVYLPHPRHDWASHPADAFAIACQSYNYIKADQRYNQQPKRRKHANLLY